MHHRRRNILSALLGVLIGVCIFAINFARPSGAKQDPPSKREVVTSVPEIVSCVKSIKVRKAEIKNPESPSAVVIIEVENTSDVGIIAISIESKKGKEAYSVIQNTFGTDEPLVIIEPHSAHRLTMALANIHPGVPIEIGSVVFADGTEEGCTLSLESMHETKSMHESERAKEKAKKEPK